MTLELIYVSKSTERLDTSQLEQLLQCCRQNNTSIGISGLLLYDGQGTFIQLLEGEPQHIDRLFNTICQDPRHTHIHTLSRKTITQRSFSDWRMGFHYFSDTPVSLPDGYSEWLTKPEPNSTDQLNSFALSLLNYFRDTSRTGNTI